MRTKKVKPPVSPEQLWARNRNFSKRRVTAVQVTMFNLATNTKLMTAVERSELALIAAKLRNLLTAWDARNEQSKQQSIRK